MNGVAIDVSFFFILIFSPFSTNVESGHIAINSRPRDLKLFRRQTAYIMQDYVLQTHITVWEAMHFSANLKIGNHLSHSEKKIRVSFGNEKENKTHIAHMEPSH